jgi:putative ABC transport system permease protein
LRIRLPEQHYPTGAQQALFFEQLLQAFRKLPTVESAVLASGVPPRLSAYVRGPIVEGYEEAGRAPSITSVVEISPGYFDVVRTRIVRGRGFTAEDQHDAPSQLGVINEALARRYWGLENAIGKRFRLDENGEWITVIGVAQDIKAFGLADDPDRMQMYYLQRPETPSATFAIRATTHFSTIIPTLKQQVAFLDPNLPIREVVAVEDELADTIAREKFTTALFTAFAALAIVLAVAGVYAVVSVAVTLRLRELGIRIALGAESRNIMGVVLKQGMRPVALGVVVGLAASAGLQRTVEGLLFNVSGTDPAVWVASAAALIFVGAAACYVPARRAMRLDPVETLRTE